jgi:hypothetical protein
VSRRPIFILGLMPRTGTVFLSELLNLHPDVAPPEPIVEDYLLTQSAPLLEFADDMAALWQRAHSLARERQPDVLRALGDGLVSMLAGVAGARRVVTKTPSVHNLGHFFELFPEGRPIVLVRDGRAAVDSYVRSFGGNHRVAMRMWAAGARTVLEFTRTARSGSYCLVRYEDLVSDLDSQLPRVLEFCELDASRYDFEAAAKLPVYGSSRLRGPSGELTWSPQRPPPGFAPTELPRWDARRREEFEAIAGDLLRAFGYESQERARRRVRLQLAISNSLWASRPVNRLRRLLGRA